MRRTQTNWLTVMGALLAALPLSAQPVQPPPVQPPAVPPAKAKSQLEDWLEKTLKTHPDIKVAESKLRSSMAEVEQARAQVMQKVLSAYYAIEAQKIAVEKSEAVLRAGSALPEATRDAAQREFATAKAKLAELQAQADQLIGKSAISFTKLAFYNLDKDGHLDLLGTDVQQYKALAWLAESMERTKVKAAPSGPMAERIRTALDRTVSFEIKNKPFKDVLEALRNQVEEVNIYHKDVIPEGTVSCKFHEVSVGAVFQWIEDSSVSGTRVYVRDYGLLVTSDSKGPAGAVPLSEFWKPAKPGK